MNLSEEKILAVPIIFTCLTVSASLLIGQPIDLSWYLEAGTHASILLLTLLATNESKVDYSMTTRRRLLAVVALGVLLLQFFDRQSIVLIYSVMLTSVLTFFLPLRSCVAYIFTVILAFLMIRFFYWELGFSWQEALIWSSFHAFSLLVTLRMIREQQARQEISLINRQLESTQALLSQSVAENERLSMARELHDNVGHHLTALIIQLDIARRSVDPAQVEPVEQSYHQAKDLLASIREVVSNKRHLGALDLKAALSQLCQNLPRLHCQLDFADNVHISNVAKAQCLLRCSQEAISNTLKHSFANAITVNLYNHGNKHILEINDDGGTSPDPVAGNGLKGMGERCQDLAGQLYYSATSQGFRIRIELPHD